MNTTLNTATPYTFIAVGQDAKTLTVKKFRIEADPETTLEEIVSSVYSKSIPPEESCEVTLTLKGHRSIANAYEQLGKPHDFKKGILETKPFSQQVAAFLWKSLKDVKILDGVDMAVLSSENPVGGPFAVFDTAKDSSTWTWTPLSPLTTFPDASKISLESSIGPFRNQTILLIGPHIPPLLESAGREESSNYPGNFF